MVDPLVLAGLLNQGWQNYTFEPFHEGVEIFRLVDGEPAVALLRYAPGASVPYHRHAGLETLIVLSGSQSDENGCYQAGTIVINPEGSEHSVWSEEGCVVLLQWDRPVVFIDRPVAAGTGEADG